MYAGRQFTIYWFNLGVYGWQFTIYWVYTMYILVGSLLYIGFNLGVFWKAVYYILDLI